ncbi:hypothetical protein J8I29_15735 [Labrys sp. LIt4]|uniref:hypothetical protein n=1 Tax=Labrys sp. LIt4 TaxID=2821355 RepID=UPI001ADF129F|nr:hypothetical protein [Labrys sp. LIt4]MBP0580778.1 hypothetical protein [Labrys sp. LIt4]
MPIASASPGRTLPARNRSPLRLSFVFKVLAIIVLAVLADFTLSAGQALPQAGSIIGFLAFAWLGALLACDSLMRRNRASRLAVIGASLAGFALIVEPSPLAGLLFLTGLAGAGSRPSRSIGADGHWPAPGGCGRRDRCPIQCRRTPL